MCIKLCVLVMCVNLYPVCAYAQRVIQNTLAVHIYVVSCMSVYQNFLDLNCSSRLQIKKNSAGRILYYLCCYILNFCYYILSIFSLDIIVGTHYQIIT